MGAIALLFPPSEEVVNYCQSRSYQPFQPVYADPDTGYRQTFEIPLGTFERAIALPGQPHDVVFISEVKGKKIDSVFVGSCTNGRMEDMRTAAELLKRRKVAPGVVLKIVPATDEIWNICLNEGLIEMFKTAGALVGNAGCAGCASGQIGQNGPGEKTISTGNRNFEGKQGKGEVYLASVATAIASAIEHNWFGVRTLTEGKDALCICCLILKVLNHFPQTFTADAIQKILDVRARKAIKSIEAEADVFNKHGRVAFGSS